MISKPVFWIVVSLAVGAVFAAGILTGVIARSKAKPIRSADAPNDATKHDTSSAIRMGVIRSIVLGAVLQQVIQVISTTNVGRLWAFAVLATLVLVLFVLTFIATKLSWLVSWLNSTGSIGTPRFSNRLEYLGWMAVFCGSGVGTILLRRGQDIDPNPPPVPSQVSDILAKTVNTDLSSHSHDERLPSPAARGGTDAQALAANGEDVAVRGDRLDASANVRAEPTAEGGAGSSLVTAFPSSSSFPRPPRQADADNQPPGPSLHEILTNISEYTKIYDCSPWKCEWHENFRRIQASCSIKNESKYAIALPKEGIRSIPTGEREPRSFQVVRNLSASETTLSLNFEVELFKPGLTLRPHTTITRRYDEQQIEAVCRLAMRDQ